MKHLKNLKISHKIYGGFAVVVGLLLVNAIVSSIYLSSSNSGFGSYRGYALETNQSGRVQANVLLTRVYAKDYITNPKEETVAKVRERASASLELAEELLSLTQSPENKALAEKIVDELKEYQAAFEVVTKHQADRNQYVNGTLNVVGPQMEKKLTEVMLSAYKDDDAEAAYNAGIVMRNLLLARLYVYRFLTDNEESSHQRASQELVAMDESLAVLLDKLQNPNRRALTNDVTKLLNEYESAFKAVIGSINSRNDLIRNTLDVIGPSIAYEVEDMKLRVKAEQDRIGPLLSSDMNAAVYINITIAVISLAFGVLAAVVISRAISSPMTKMTNTMNTLANGNTDIEVPAQGQKDEIGSMAKAVHFFKDNMIERERLEKETKKREQEEAERAREAQAKEEARLENERERERNEAEAQRKRGELISSLTNSFETKMTTLLSTLTGSATELQSTANSLVDTADGSKNLATAVASAAHEASTNTQTVASAAEELTSSIREISRQTSQAAEISESAVSEAEHSSRTVNELAEASKKISDVIDLINDIAGQTNLLALNATIEAARAGDAGKGFAVVASEVKSLANQTAKATEEISLQISQMQSSTDVTVGAIEKIGKVIESIRGTTTGISSAVEQQSAATNEISQNVQEASKGTNEVSEKIELVSAKSQETGVAADQVLSASQTLDQLSRELKDDIEKFLTEIQAA